MVFGICPFVVEDQWKQMTIWSKIYANCILLTISTGTVIIYYYQFLANKISNIMIEKMLSLCGVSAGILTYFSLLYSHVFELDAWISVFTNIEKFDEKFINIGNNYDDVESLEYIFKRVNNNLTNEKVNLVIDCTLCNFIKQVMKINHSQHRLFHEILQFLLVQLAGLCLIVFDVILLFHSGSVSQSDLLYYLPYMAACLYQIFICQLVEKLSNIFTHRYHMINNHLQLFFQGVKDESCIDLKLKVHQIKEQYQLLYHTVNCLSRIFGSTLLFLFIFSQVQFLISCSLYFIAESKTAAFAECFISGFCHVVSTTLYLSQSTT